MAKLPPSATPTAQPQAPAAPAAPPAYTVTTAPNDLQRVPAAAELDAARRRIAELEGLLRDARAQVSAACTGKSLHFPYPLLPAADCAKVSGERVAFAFWEGQVGLDRKQRYVSLHQGLYRAGAKLADGTPIGTTTAHALLYLLDHMTLGEG